jgi:hypothetical protein
MIEVNLNSTTEVEVLSNVANKLVDLVDVNPTGITSTSFNYLLAYDASTQKFQFVDPDDVLVSAASTIQSSSSAGDGLPVQFINALDTDPNRIANIDLDGGSF